VECRVKKIANVDICSFSIYILISYVLLMDRGALNVLYIQMEIKAQVCTGFNLCLVVVIEIKE
jgi:hypothetical protein